MRKRVVHILFSQNFGGDPKKPRHAIADRTEPRQSQPAVSLPRKHFPMAELSILGTVAAQDWIALPFPHLLRSPAIPSPLYRRLAAEFPSIDAILHDRVDTWGNVSARLPAHKVRGNAEVSETWREFFAFHTSHAFWREIVTVFGAQFRTLYPEMEAKVGRPLEEWRTGLRRVEDDTDVRLDCQFVINTPGDTASSVKTAHVDKNNTLFSMLWYFRDPADRGEGGDLALYAWKRRPRVLHPRRTVLFSDIKHHGTVRYAPNTLVAFVNSMNAVHGVTVRAPSPLPRRYINLVATTPFNVFAMRRLSRLERLIHRRQMGRMEIRALQGDKY
jgi:hypothetical protein